MVIISVDHTHKRDSLPNTPVTTARYCIELKQVKSNRNKIQELQEYLRWSRLAFLIPTALMRVRECVPP